MAGKTEEGGGMSLLTLVVLILVLSDIESELEPCLKRIEELEE